ncbi:MAG: hypothetical protein INR71_10185 [Terriglobus roseus]|nr:hypothetical protein [Terriglobus roseus]
MLQLGKTENKRAPASAARIARQKQKTLELMKKYGLEGKDTLTLNRKIWEEKGKSKL